MASPPATRPPGPSASRIRIDSRRRRFPDLREVFQHRELIVLFGRRDITARYRQTVLGSVWIFAGPLVSAGLFSFVFGRVAALPSGGVPYFVFSYAGLLAWSLFSGSLSSASTSITANAGLITKIYFPRLVVPFSTMASPLLNFFISLGVMIFLLLISGVGFTVQLVVLPVWIILAIVLGMGLALTLTSLSVWYRDVGYVTPLVLQLLLYLSPVAYSLDAVPENLRNLYLLNPLTTILEGARWSLLGGSSSLPPAWAIAYTVVFSLVALTSGMAVFANLEGNFADAI